MFKNVVITRVLHVYSARWCALWLILAHHRKVLFFSSPRRNRFTAPSQTLLLFPYTQKKATQPSQHFSSLHPFSLASMDEWQLQSSLASSCSPCMEACSITKTGWKWCESSFLQSTLPRISLYTSAISQIPTQHLISTVGWIYGIKSESIRASLISEKTKCILQKGNE